MKEYDKSLDIDEVVCVENNTVHYSKISEQLLLEQEKALYQHGFKYGHLTAVYCRQNVLFHPLIMVIQRIASEILFLNENSVKWVSDILSVSYFISDTEMDDGKEVGYEKNEVTVWGRKLYLYTKLGKELADQEVKSNDRSCLFMTSGTTGVPDIVYKKVSVLEKEGRIIAERLHYTKEDHILAIAPPYHAYCNAYACFAPAYSGASVTYMGNIVTKQSILRKMQKEQYTVIISTPFYFDQLLDVEQLTLLRLRVCSGGALTGRMKKSEICFHNAYGSTETGAICIELYENGGSNEDVGSEYSDVKVFFGDEKGKANEGCISVETGHLMFKRIRNRKVEYISGTEWVLNDIGFRDLYGNIFVMGRNDSIVNIGGEKVSLREVEEKICEIPNIKEAKVKAEADKNNNTYIIAYISLIDQSKSTDVRKELLTILPVSKIPRKIVIKKTLAKTATGKIKENQ